MSTVDTYLAPRPSTSSLWEQLVTKLTVFLRTVRASKRRRIAVVELDTLDVRTLKDIGIDRSEIKSIVYCGTAERKVNHEND